MGCSRNKSILDWTTTWLDDNPDNEAMHAEHAIGRFSRVGITRACGVTAAVIRHKRALELPRDSLAPDDQDQSPVTKSASVRLDIALAAVGDIANSFVVSFLPFPLVFASYYCSINYNWLWFYAAVAAWAAIALIWGILLAVTSFKIPRCSLRIGDPNGPDVMTPVRCAFVMLFHCSVQFFMYRYVYG